MMGASCPCANWIPAILKQNSRMQHPTCAIFIDLRMDVNGLIRLLVFSLKAFMDLLTPWTWMISSGQIRHGAE
jgi:hypothetical protein